LVPRAVSRHYTAAGADGQAARVQRQKPGFLEKPGF